MEKDVDIRLLQSEFRMYDTAWEKYHRDISDPVSDQGGDESQDNHTPTSHEEEE